MRLGFTREVQDESWEMIGTEKSPQTFKAIAFELLDPLEPELHDLVFTALRVLREPRVQSFYYEILAEKSEDVAPAFVFCTNEDELFVADDESRGCLRLIGNARRACLALEALVQGKELRIQNPAPLRRGLPKLFNAIPSIEVLDPFREGTLDFRARLSELPVCVSDGRALTMDERLLVASALRHGLSLRMEDMFGLVLAIAYRDSNGFPWSAFVLSRSRDGRRLYFVDHAEALQPHVRRALRQCVETRASLALPTPGRRIALRKQLSVQS